MAHGGDLNQARGLFPDAPGPWIDLSTGINPVAYPIPTLPAALFQRLPPPGDVAALEAIAARAYGANDPRCVVAAPGTQALIGWLPRLRPPGRVAILGPTYAEHALAWRAGGHAVMETTRLDESAEVVVVVNPNNPDGRVFSRDALLEAAARLERRGGWLVVDEAFIDLEPVDGLAPSLPRAAIVLRSFGKTYGLAGLRLGFAVADPAVTDQLRGALGPWAISGPALAIGARALADGNWRLSAAADRAAEVRRLDDLLRSAGPVVGGTRLFRLMETGAAPALFEHLAHRGIWTRRFATLPDRLRLSPPGSEREWGRLEAALLGFGALNAKPAAD